MNTIYPEKTIITTGRLKFRPLEMSDLENLMGIFSDRIAMEYYPSTKSTQEAKQWIKYVQNTVDKHGLGMMDDLKSQETLSNTEETEDNSPVEQT